MMYNRAKFFKDLDCPRKVKKVLFRATEPDRDERFGTMTEFGAALRKAFAEPPTGTVVRRESAADRQPPAPPPSAETPVNCEDVAYCYRPAPLPYLPREFVNSIGMKFVLIPAGTFRMGSPESEEERLSDEGPVHEVQITRPFYMSVTPVTQEQYEKVMGSNPSYFSAKGDGKDKVRGMDTPRSRWRWFRGMMRLNSPRGWPH